MSIRMEDWYGVIDNIKKVRQKVTATVGYGKCMNSNHYGQTLLYNEYIYQDTPESKIQEICDNYSKLYYDIIKVFIENEMDEVAVRIDSLFSLHPFDGHWRFLGVVINVYKGIKPLLKTINDYIYMYKKVKLLSLKYKHLGEIDFFQYIDYFSQRPAYSLYGDVIHAKTKDDVIDDVLSRYNDFNKRFLKLISSYEFKYKTLLIGKGEGMYKIFDIYIKKDITDDKMLDIIKKAKIFEGNICSAVKELGLNESFKGINYGKNSIGDGIFVSIGIWGIGMQIDYDYDLIKKVLSKK